MRALVCLAAALMVLVYSARAEPNLLDFSDGGFEEGSLDGQNTWMVRTQAPANADLVFKSGTGVALTENTGGTHSAAYAFVNDKTSPMGLDSFIAGMPLSLTANLVLTQEPGPKKGPIVGLGWGLFIPVGPNCLPFFAELARDTEAGGYRLRLVKSSEKTMVEGETVVMIPEGALGFSAGDAESDPLQLSFTLTNQGSKTDWSTVSMLTNLKTNKVFVLKNTITAPEVYKTDGLIRAIVNPRRKGEDGLSSVIITKLDADVTPDPTTQ